MSKLKEFTYCVGRPWPNSTAICIYAYGTQVHHGTMEDAKNFREYVNAKTGEKNFIYKIVPVSEDETAAA